MIAAATVSMVGHGALCVLFLVAASVLLPDAPPAQAVFLSLLGMLANALPVTPGGIGVGEAAVGGLLYVVGGASGRRMQAAVTEARGGSGA